MTQRSIRRAACAGVLAAGLALSSPAHAAGWGGWAVETGLWTKAWSWIAGFWGMEHPVPARVRQGGVQEKRSGGIDPDGSPTSSATSTPSTPPLCQTACERSSGIDPDG